jgi:hypothetical protein
MSAGEQCTLMWLYINTNANLSVLNYSRLETFLEKVYAPNADNRLRQIVRHLPKMHAILDFSVGKKKEALQR